MNFRVLFAAIVAVFLAVPAFATESVEGFSATAITMTDGNGDKWSFGDGSGTGQGAWVSKNGVHLSGAYGYFMYYHNHTIYWQQNDASWHLWDGSAVQSASDPRGSCPRSANGATVTSTSGSICDASGVSWTLTTGTGLQVTKAGTKQGTADVVLMYYDNPDDRIYQENSDGYWWYTAASGTVSWVATVDPRVSANCDSTSYCDDFNGTTLNASEHMNTSYRWGYADTSSLTWDGGDKNGGWQVNPLHTGTTSSTFTNLYKLDGSGDLVLGIDNTPGTCTTVCGNDAHISSQLIATAPFTVGHYIEVRAKVTATNGTNFALWLYDDHSGSGGVYQEADLVEIVRAYDNSSYVAAQTLHHDGISGNEGWNNYSMDVTAWHTYGVDWEAGSICYYIDRVQTGCSTSGGSSYNGSMHLYLSSQLASASWGGPMQAGTTMPGSMTIDYVRAYDHKPF